MDLKKGEIKLKIYENKINKQKTLILPKKIVGDINEVIFDKKSKICKFF